MKYTNNNVQGHGGHSRSWQREMQERNNNSDPPHEEEQNPYPFSLLEINMLHHGMLYIEGNTTNNRIRLPFTRNSETSSAFSSSHSSRPQRGLLREVLDVLEQASILLQSEEGDDEDAEQEEEPQLLQHDINHPQGRFPTYNARTPTTEDHSVSTPPRIPTEARHGGVSPILAAAQSTTLAGAGVARTRTTTGEDEAPPGDNDEDDEENNICSSSHPVRQHYRRQ